MPNNAEQTLREVHDDTMATWTRERPDIDFTAMGTVLRVGQLMNIAVKGFDELLLPLGINLGEFDVLAALRRGGVDNVLTPTQLANVAMLSPGGMTNRLNRLEKRGYIRRRPDPLDRRGSLVTLTKAGVKIADAAVELVIEAQTGIVNALTPKERERLDRSLDKLISAVVGRAEGESS